MDFGDIFKALAPKKRLRVVYKLNDSEMQKRKSLDNACRLAARRHRAAEKIVENARHEIKTWWRDMRDKPELETAEPDGESFQYDPETGEIWLMGEKN